VIRIANIDTAEMEGRCESERVLARRAKVATKAALDEAGSITLQSYERPRDRHGRTLAYVLVDGRDLGELLVAQRVLGSIPNGLTTIIDCGAASGRRRQHEWPALM
jgi:endonuclease YncB( thermonuclease family)